MNNIVIGKCIHFIEIEISQLQFGYFYIKLYVKTLCEIISQSVDALKVLKKSCAWL